MTSSLALRTRPPIAGSLRTHQRVLDVLLGDRRSALGVAAEEVVLGRAGEAGEREAGVGVEVAVFCGHHRVAHMYRDLVDVDVDAVAFGRDDFRQFAAVAGQDRRHLIGADVAGLGHVDDQVGHRERHHRQHQEQRRHREERATHPHPVDLLAEPRPGSGRPPGGRRRRVAHRRPAAGAVAVVGRRRAVQCGLDDVDRVAQMGVDVVADRRQDRGQPVVGRNGRPGSTRGIGGRRPPGGVGLSGWALAAAISRWSLTDITG